MRFPVKLNRGYWPDFLCKFIPAANDVTGLLNQQSNPVEFGKAVCAIKIGGTFKTTQQARYPLMVSALNNLNLPQPPVVLDIAASDGSASLSTIEQLQFKHYYITDRNPLLYYTHQAATYYFYEPEGNCILVANRKYVFYQDTDQAVWPFGRLANGAIGSAPGFCQSNCSPIRLINPAVPENDEQIVVQQHDMFNPWPGEAPDIIIAANILNRVYFDESTLNRAINVLLENLDGQGYLAISDNRPTEHGSLFFLSHKRLTLIDSINGGADTESLVLDTIIQ